MLKMRRVFILLLVSMLGVGLNACSSTKLTAKAEHVRVTNDPNIVKGYRYIKTINATSKNMSGGLLFDTRDACVKKLQNEAANIGGDIVYIVSENGNPAYMSMRADVYKKRK